MPPNMTIRHDVPGGVFKESIGIFAGRDVFMSLGAKIAVSVMRGIKKTGLIKGPSADLDAALRKARDYNRKHPFKEPTDRKADYQTIQVGQYPCLIIKPENGTRKAILFLHGGGDHDAWKPEVSFARTYGKRAGMDVYYPLYPPFTEASPAQTADFIFAVYREMAKKYGVSIPQLCIRYDIQLGMVVLPKTANPAHMKTNADVDFVITDEDMEILKHAEKIDNYGDSSFFPVFGGKLRGYSGKPGTEEV